MGNELSGLTPHLDRLATEGLLLTQGFVLVQSAAHPGKLFTPEDSHKAPVCSGMQPTAQMVERDKE